MFNTWLPMLFTWLLGGTRWEVDTMVYDMPSHLLSLSYKVVLCLHYKYVKLTMDCFENKLKDVMC